MRPFIELSQLCCII